MTKVIIFFSTYSFCLEGSCSIVLRGASKHILEEAERSMHDALCVVRCLVKNRGIIPGGGAIEIELS